MTTPDSPTHVGAYRLLAKIGEGGMGVVHLAEDERGRRVAVKMLRPHVVGDEHGRARMAREVTSMRRVRSPHVAEIYDADPWGETPYVVTRYVAGLSLHDQVAQHGPLTGHDLHLFALGLAQALLAVHQADVMHRDVKPSNVLVEGSNPVLIDFGLAQLSDDSKLTHTGWLLGTPGYLAPEILFGDDPTPAADVHSWASTVVFAATGKGPFGKGPAVAVMDRVRRGEADLEHVPFPIVDLCRQALSPDPRERPTTGQVVQWLTALVEGRRLPWRPPPPTNRPQHPASAPAAAVAARQHRPPGLTTSQDSGPRPLSPQPVHGARPVGAYRPRRSVAALFWLGLLAVVLAAAVTVPFVGLLSTLALGWTLRTVTVRMRTVASWRAQRGARRSDAWTAALCTPWFAAVALPGTLANAGLGLIDGIIVVVVASLAAPDVSAPLVLLAGTLIAVVFTWWGPFSRDLRYGGRRLSSAVLQPGAPTVLMLLLLAVAFVGLVLMRMELGPQYQPFPEPPWKPHIERVVG